MIALWQQGDAGAFEFLYKKNMAYLVNVAAKRVDSIEVATDLVQDVFLNVYIKRDSINATSELAPYLLKALKNRIYNYYRKKLSENKYENSVRTQMYIVTDDTHQQVEAKELNRQINEKIHQLPESRRQIFLMRQEGISNKEIAEKLNISVNTVESQMHKALRFLKSAVNNFFLFLF